MRSKRNVVLVILGGMLAFFLVGIAFRTFHPTAVVRVVRQLPTYPGAEELAGTAPQSQDWTRIVQRGNPEGEVRIVVYRLPNGTSRGAVLAYYREHVPRDWRRVTTGCYARGDIRIRILPLRANELDVIVAERARC